MQTGTEHLRGLSSLSKEVGRFITLILAFLVILALPVQTGFAQNLDFLNDWMDQQNSTSPGVHKGSQYNYLMGGSYSARNRLTSDPIFNVSPPRMAIGCGGIDIFMGSYAMTDPKYLMQKMERILQASPVAAFDLAMKTLCPSCTDTIHSIESTLDRLNTLQLDECAASKAMVATIASPYSNNNQISEDIQNFDQSTGASDMWHKITEQIRADDGKITTAAVDKLISGCTAPMKQVFGKTGSVLSHLGEKLGYPEGHLNAIRGMFGDIIIVKDNGYMVKLEPACSSNAVPSLEKFIQGHAEQKIMEADGITTKCINMKRTANGATNSLEDNSKATMMAVRDKMKSKSDMTAAEKSSIESASIPIHLVMKISATTKMEDSMLNEFGKLWAMDRAYRMLGDMASMAETASMTAMQIVSVTGPQPEDCKIRILDNAVQGYVDLRDNVWRVHQMISKEYEQAIATADQRLSHLEKMGGFDKKEATETKESIRGGMLGAK